MLIDVDLKPEESIEMEARVVADAVGEGVIEPRTALRWSKLLRSLIGKEIRITLTRFKKRTLPQNRLVWWCNRFIFRELVERCAEAGEKCPFESEDDLHEFFKATLIGTTVATMLGQAIELPPSTTKLSTRECSAYVDGMVARAATWSVFCPLPGDLVRAMNEQAA